MLTSAVSTERPHHYDSVLINDNHTPEESSLIHNNHASSSQLIQTSHRHTEQRSSFYSIQQTPKEQDPLYIKPQRNNLYLKILAPTR